MSDKIKGKKILCIDDDRRMLDLIKAQLNSLDADVILTSTAAQARELLDNGLEPDIILCDIMMPGQDGYSFHEEIRHEARWVRIPFIYVTALSEYSNYRQGMGLGADGYLTKPFNQKRLKQELEHVLQRHEELSAQKVTIRMLGTQNVRIGEQLDKAPDRGAEQLVFYLLLQGEGILKRRSDIMVELWKEITLSGFRSVLSRTKRWSDNWAQWDITNQTVTMRLQDHVMCDLYELETLLDKLESDENISINLNAIEELYQGPLLPSYHDDWVLHRREVLASRVKNALMRTVNPDLDMRGRALHFKRLLSIMPDEFELWSKYITCLDGAGLHVEAKYAREQLEHAHMLP